MSMPPPPPPGQNPPPFQPGQQPPPGYQQFGAAPVASTSTNGFAVTSLVLGIVGIPLFCLWAIPSILAVIFGGIALNQFKQAPTAKSGRGLAVAGLVLGLVGIGILILVLAVGNARYTIN